MNDKYKIKSNESVAILPLSDLHVGSKQFNEDFFDEWLKMAKRTKNKRIYCLGDMIEFASKKVGDSSYNQVVNPNEQIDYVVDKLKSLKDDIIYFTDGNHEARATMEFQLDIAKIMADRLGVPYSHGFIFEMKKNTTTSIGRGSSNSSFSLPKCK